MASAHTLRNTTMNVRLLVTIRLIVVVLISYGSAFSQNKEQERWYETVSLNGFLSTEYIYNSNQPDTRNNTYHVFDTNSETFGVGVFELSVKNDAVKTGDAGFRVDVTAGSSVPRVSHSAGLQSGDLDIQQAYVSYLIPLGDGLKIDAGKFVTPAGYELIDGYDGFNDNFSRSFLFGYAIPFTHTGVKASYSFNDLLSAQFMLVNGWDNTIDNNGGKTIGAQLTTLPTEGMTLTLCGITGPEKTDNSADYRSLIDFIGAYTVNDLVTVGCNLDYGCEEHATVEQSTASWFGVAGYFRLNISDLFSAVVRAEQFEDRDGIRTLTPQILKEITLTPEFRPAEHVVLRADIRLDKSDREVFLKGNTLKSTQGILGFNMIYLF